MRKKEDLEDKENLGDKGDKGEYNSSFLAPSP